MDWLRHAAALYGAGKAPLVIASGGGIVWYGTVEPEAVSMRALLLRLGYRCRSGTDGCALDL